MRDTSAATDEVNVKRDTNEVTDEVNVRVPLETFQRSTLTFHGLQTLERLPTP